MKAIKKLAAVLAAATVTVGALAVSSFAADDTYKLYVKADKGSVGDSVPVSVLVDSNETLGVGVLQFDINYDPTELEFQADTFELGEAVSNPREWMVNGDEVDGYVMPEPGTLRIVYVTMKDNVGIKTVGAELMKFNLKVLKPNAKITLNVEVFSGDDADVTDLMNDSTFEGATVECSHKNTDVKTVVEDCTKGGTSTTTCKDCEEVVKTEEVAPTDHTIEKWTVKTPATCTAEGEEEGTCSVCGQTATRKIDMIPHSFGDYKVTTPATCTEKGVETSECSVCGETQTRDIDALGHDFGEYKVTKEPTCTEKGVETAECSRCDAVDTRDIDMIDHDVEWTVTKEATCTEAGSRTGKCSICGEEVTEEIAALGHDWDEWKVVEEATTEKEGSEERECKRCGEKETRVIDKLAPVDTDAPETDAPAATTPAATNKPNNANGDGNKPTGVAIAIIPVLAAGAAVVVLSKKRK